MKTQEDSNEKIPFIDKLDNDKTDTEIIIQELHDTTEQLEILQRNTLNSIAKRKLFNFIKEMNNEIEWNEQILQELNDSIKFAEEHDNRVNYGLNYKKNEVLN